MPLPRVARSVLSRLTTPGPLLAIGLGAATVGGSLWIAIANRSLDAHSATTLLSFYFLVGTIGTGVLAGLEQEMTRTVARTHAANRPVGAAVRGQLRQAAGLVAVTGVVLLAASPLLLSRWLGHSWTLELALAAGLAATWASFLVRGVLAGCQDFRYYSLTLIVQGVATIVPSVILTSSGRGHLLGYAFVFALAPLVAAVSGLASPALRRSWRAVGSVGSVRSVRAAGAVGAAAAGDAESAAVPSVPDDAEEPGGSAREKLILLTLATLLSQLLINAVPLIISSRLDAGHAKSLDSAMGMSRLALLCLFPLQAPLLPMLAAAAVRGDFREVRRKTGFLVAACLGTGAAGVVVVAAAGPWLLRHYFAATDPLSHLFLSALALSTAFLMTAFVLQSAQVALNRHRVVFAAWLAGLATMALVFVLPLSPLAAAGWAGILGPLAVTVIAAADVMFVTRSLPTVTGPDAEPAAAVPAPVEAPVEASVEALRPAPAPDAGQAEPVAEGVRG
ncbi:O-antigen/teichoic acid export membrane protein [Catenulispora sp. EB89]|uniref:hypothetical protein n=1 Tax=Catenulispora sp. EB89 TaxID=3156257 RepID=UPI0035185A47